MRITALYTTGSMVVAICVWGGKEKERRRCKLLEGSRGMLPQKIFKFRSPKMPFPEANSGQVMFFQR